MIEDLIPIAMFASIVVVVGMLIVFKNKAKHEQQKTLRTAMEKGQQLTPELIAQIAAPPAKSRDRDLRAALVYLAVGGGFVALGLAIGDDEGTPALLGVASFPLLIGAAYLIMHFFGSKED